MKEPIFSVSGVRGILGKTLTFPVVSNYAGAFAQYCHKRKGEKKIVIGRDGRLRGEEISAVVTSVLQISGFHVTDIGVATTPTVQIAVEKLKASGGISITASHNPQEWNGLKFLNADGTFLIPEEISELRKYYTDKSFNFMNLEDFSAVQEDDTWHDKHVKYVLKTKMADIARIKKRKFRVVVDAVNASGSVIVPMMLKELGCRVTELYCDRSGKFPHMPEPLTENLKSLCNAVTANKADLGIAVDPDGDRLVLITEKGTPFIEEYTIVMVIRNILRKSERVFKKVVVNMSTTRAVDDAAEEFNARVFRSPVGEINVVSLMKAKGAIAGGEGSGGVIIPNIHYGRDAVAGIPLILDELAHFGGTLSEYKKTLPEYHIVKDRIEISENPDIIFEKIMDRYKTKGCRFTVTDGLKLDFDEYWVHLRKSNTEPIIRIITEAKSKKTAEKIQSEFKGIISGIIRTAKNT